MKPNSIRTMPIHQKMRIPYNTSNNPICGKNDLFAIVLIFKIMLPKSSFNKFFQALKKQMDTLSGALATINISDVEKEMGFPPNWTDIKSV